MLIVKSAGPDASSMAFQAWVIRFLNINSPYTPGHCLPCRNENASVFLLVV